jgi:hypothetical protein
MDTKKVKEAVQLQPDYSVRCEELNDMENFNKKLYLYNTARTCEFELTQTEWHDAEYYTKPKIPLDYFNPFLKLVRSEYAGSEVQVCKNTYVA